MDQNKSAPPSGPRKIGNWTVVVDRDLCIGAASCVAVAPKTFALDNEAKAIFLDTCDEENPDVLMDSAKSCPVAAIIITDETGKQVYP
ncbi:ferredoxin [Candidatus Gottesmanbacteria bacterium]|nr:ferredoxin [Candidatus Gottesmanbacteria bacterium]